MAKDGHLRLRVLDQAGRPFGGEVEIRLYHHVLSDRRRLKVADASETVLISDLHAMPQGLYRIEVAAQGHRLVNQFVNIKTSGYTDLEIHLQAKAAKEKNGLDELLRRDPLLRYRYDPDLGVVRNLRGSLASLKKKSAAELQRAGTEFLKKHSSLFGTIDLDRTETLQKSEDPLGGTSLTLQQYHGPYRVSGGTVRFHTDQKGVLDSISNRLYPDLKKLPLEPKLKEEMAVEKARTCTEGESELGSKPELMVDRHEGAAHLEWEVRLNQRRPVGESHSWLAGQHGAPPEWVVRIDAMDGKVLSCYDNLQTIAVVGNGTGQWSGVGTINAWQTPTSFQLRDTTRSPGGPEILTDDEDGASPSEDADNNWQDIVAAPRDQNQGAEVDTHRYIGQAIDYFQVHHGRNSIDDAGMNVEAIVHYGTDHDNAYWSPFLQKIRVGDGSGIAPGFDYLCTNDILGHEFTHGVTEHTCGLVYQNESGALNEAFSDTFAAYITADWLIGENCWLNGPPATALRNMQDPTNGGNWDPTDPITSVLAGHQPSHYSVRYTGPLDNGGVHINSGIINNLIYLLTVGGTHAVSGITVTGIGQSPTERLLYYCMTNTLLGQPNASFLDFREAMLDAWMDLFPTDLLMLTQIKNAFNAVGIGPDIYVRDNLLDSGAEPYAGAYLWASPDIINRQSVSPDPDVEFADFGDGSLWENVEFGQANWVYVRLQNRGAENGDAVINVYFTPASTFATPASWIHVGTLNETGIAPGALAIAGPLEFQQSLIPGPGHYCMIAVVTDALDPAPNHNLIGSTSDFLHFVRNTNNIAYRNMDVVDLMPAMPGVLEAVVRGFPGVRERFDLRVDLKNFVPGAKIRVRGPALDLDKAIPRGFRLVAREKEENVYELLEGRRLAQDRAALLAKESRVGFDNLLAERDFRIVVEYRLPDKPIMRTMTVPKEGFTLMIRQLWNDETVGAVGVQLREPPQVH